ncbi:MAG: hypothetical protein HKN17_00690 [Rhodothermales bacterium]|nr:hypothetical protein [Rhodothermales bacterium]
MSAHFHLRRTIAPAIMLMAVVTAFTGPSIVSTVSLLGGSEPTEAAGTNQLPLDMTAAPVQDAEVVDFRGGLDGSVRLLPTSSRSTDDIRSAQPVRSSYALDDSPDLCDRTVLCVYRL